jgi:hypothetical protein
MSIKINLIPEAYANKLKTERLRNMLLSLAVLSTIIGVVANMALLGLFGTKSYQKSTIDKKITGLEEEVRAVVKGKDGSNIDYFNQYVNLSNRITLNEKLSNNRYYLSETIEELRKLIDKSKNIEVITLKIDASNKVTITGTARPASGETAAALVGDFRNRIKEYKVRRGGAKTEAAMFIGEVSDPLNYNPGPDGGYPFTISTTLNEKIFRGKVATTSSTNSQNTSGNN